MVLQNENLVIALWQDTKITATISQLKSNNWGKKKEKYGERPFLHYPGLIAKYTENMCGVDQNDQLRQYYSIRACGQKCIVYIAYINKLFAIRNAYKFYCPFMNYHFSTWKTFISILQLNSLACTILENVLVFLLYYQQKRFTRITYHRNQTTIITNVTTALHL